jgi:hypothetical protein
MVGWLTHWLGRSKAALHGGAATPRLKTYWAQSGYVYQYRFLGHRPARFQGSDATEFVFDVTAGSESGMRVSVVVPAASLAPTEAAWGRALADNERYAVAKMALFQAFDERPEPGAMRADVIVRPADAAGILARLGIA